MKDLFEFMSNSPWLTFFIVLIVMQGLIYITQAIFGRGKCDDDGEP